MFGLQQPRHISTLANSAVAAILLGHRLSGISGRPAQAAATRSEGQALSTK
jgi:hypothetical protein